MNCDKFDKSISLYIDNELSDIEKKEFELHLMKCEKCRKEYENMINIIKIIRENEQEELPESYKTGFQEKLIGASSEQRKIINWKAMASIAASLLVLFTSYELIFNNNIFELNKSEYKLEQEQSNELQEASDTTDDTVIMGQKNFPNEVNNKAMMDGASAQIDNNNLDCKDSSRVVGFREKDIYGVQATRGMMSNRKAISEAYLDISIDEFDGDIEEIVNYVKENNGFVESMEIEENQVNTDNQPLIRQQFIKIRIPQDKFKQTVEFIKDMGIIKNVQCSISDVTEQYNSVSNDLDKLYNKEYRLGEILKKIENADDRLIIEDEINEVKEQIENYSGTLNNMNDSTTLSTINTIITENVDE